MHDIEDVFMTEHGRSMGREYLHGGTTAEVIHRLGRGPRCVSGHASPKPITETAAGSSLATLPSFTLYPATITVELPCITVGGCRQVVANVVSSVK